LGTQNANAFRPAAALQMCSLLCATILAVTACLSNSAIAQTQAPVSFAGKQLSVALGYGTGGTYYAYAKLIADHLGAHVEGKPNVLVQSMPGAGGVRMLNSAAKLFAADGTQLFVPPDTMVISQTISKEGGQFDARKFHYLATINQQNNVFVTRREVATTMDDLKKREIVVGHSGIGSAGHIVPSVAKDILGLKLKLIAGYEGSRDGILAMERGEIDGAIYGWETWEQAVPHWFKGENSFAVAIFQTGPKREPSLPDVPLLRDMAKGDDRALVELTDTQVVIGRSLALPPNASSSLVAQFRKSVAQMVDDPAFKDDATRRKLILNPLTGEELQAAIDRAINAPSPALIARAKKLLQ
jgi:tripartite-type tricarboxylate transporter receptor subunit TctC